MRVRALDGIPLDSCASSCHYCRSAARVVGYLGLARHKSLVATNVGPDENRRVCYRSAAVPAHVQSPTLFCQRGGLEAARTTELRGKQVLLCYDPYCAALFRSRTQPLAELDTRRVGAEVHHSGFGGLSDHAQSNEGTCESRLYRRPCYRDRPPGFRRTLG